MLRALGQLDLTIGLSYVTLLGSVGALMMVESVRAIVRPRQGKPVDTAPARQPHLVARPAAQGAVQALEDLRLGDPGLGDRLHHRLRRRHHGHRRRLPAGADADLFPARADRRR